MDYRELLTKYMRIVLDLAGSTLVANLDDPAVAASSGVTLEEVAILQAIVHEVTQ